MNKSKSRLRIINSAKHPEDTFIKLAESNSDFICKFYKGRQDIAKAFVLAVDKMEEETFKKLFLSAPAKPKLTLGNR